jgi:hypothetical protein
VGQEIAGHLVHDEVVEGLGVWQDDVLLYIQQVGRAHPTQLPEVRRQLHSGMLTVSTLSSVVAIHKPAGLTKQMACRATLATVAKSSAIGGTSATVTLLPAC